MVSGTDSSTSSTASPYLNSFPQTVSNCSSISGVKYFSGLLFIVFFTTDLIQFSIESYNHLFGLILFPLLVLTISNNPIFVIKSKIVNYLGKISYGIYMYHAFAINFIGFLALKMNSKFNISTAAMMVVSFVLVFLTTIAAAHLSFKFFEQKFIRLKKHFR